MAGPLMAACRSWLGMWSDAEDTVPKLWADSSALDCVVHTLRGILGLCDPTPFPCSCGIADIHFAMPLEKKKKGDPPGLAEMFDKLSYSRSLWRWMNKPEGVGTAPARENLWPSRKSAYVMAVAGENQYGQHVNAAYKSAQDLSRALGIGNAVDVGTLSILDEPKDIDEQTAFLSTYEQSIEVWVHSLRPGGCHRLQRQVVILCNGCVAAASKMFASIPASQPACKLVQAVHGALKATGADIPMQPETLQAASDMLMAFKESGDKQALRRVHGGCP